MYEADLVVEKNVLWYLLTKSNILQYSQVCEKIYSSSSIMKIISKN